MGGHLRAGQGECHCRGHQQSAESTKFSVVILSKLQQSINLEMVKVLIIKTIYFNRL